MPVNNVLPDNINLHIFNPSSAAILVGCIFVWSINLNLKIHGFFSSMKNLQVLKWCHTRITLILENWLPRIASTESRGFCQSFTSFFPMFDNFQKKNSIRNPLKYFRVPSFKIQIDLYIIEVNSVSYCIKPIHIRYKFIKNIVFFSFTMIFWCTHSYLHRTQFI